MAEQQDQLGRAFAIPYVERCERKYGRVTVERDRIIQRLGRAFAVPYLERVRRSKGVSQ